MKIKMLKTVRPDMFLGKPGTILRAGIVYEAKQNKNGAVTGLCDNGEWLGVKPDEFEEVEDNADIKHVIENLSIISRNYTNYKLFAGDAEHIDIAIAALEKQIPKKPNTTPYYEEEFDSGSDHHCPNCDLIVGAFSDDTKEWVYQLTYCHDCGQKIDWSVENE